MAKQQVDITVHHPNNVQCPICTATVAAECDGRGIVTGNPGSGSPNVSMYDVTVAGHVLAGGWPDDARRNIEVDIMSDHPLAAAVVKIAAAQKALKNVRECRGAAPIGWRRDEWLDAQNEVKTEYATAKSAVDEDEIAAAIISVGGITGRVMS